jgi:hypothetical protein
MRENQSHPMGLADATLVAIAEAATTTRSSRSTATSVPTGSVTDGT